ncbi:MAG: 2-oxoacid:acceptor oxidoreductase family protein [Deltaproteobacteria bacterium]|nr:2-oxoacid:acceptor oxidoreductase family protein [Deltaproteobacteria bacterium]
MIEIRFHGRGGQGAVIASKILAMAFFAEGKYVQSFPLFGVERRGAPVAAFTRVDDKPVRMKCNIYTPDCIIVLDPTLTRTVDIAAGLKKGGSILINSDLPPEEYKEKYSGFNIATIDADSIAREFKLGSLTSPIINTVILGAFSAQTGLVKLESIQEGIRKEIPIKTEANCEAAKKAYENVKLLN